MYFHRFEFQKFTKSNKISIFERVEIIKAQAGFGLMNWRFVPNALNHYATLLGINFGQWNIYKIRLDLLFIQNGTTS